MEQALNIDDVASRDAAARAPAVQISSPLSITSGMSQATPVVSSPPEHLPFNWGAFGLTPLWMMFHGKVGWGLGLIGMNFVLNGVSATGTSGAVGALAVGILVACFAGAEGNRIAWSHHRVESVKELKAKELGWNIAGCIALALQLILAVVVLAAAIHE